MRVVGGRFKGRPLAGPRSNAIRPTSDRMRESLFNILAHGYGFPDEGTRVLDLFAGTGALGLEAISRGAASALFFDTGVEARALIRQNIESLGLTGVARIFRRDATKAGLAGTIAPFDLVFCDPPYRKGLGEKALNGITAGKWITSGALCVVEEAADMNFSVPSNFKLFDRRTSGETQIFFLKYFAEDR